MVELETVLVLGAGASKDFGFPTGKDLVTRICDMLRNQENKEYKMFYECADRLNLEAATYFADHLAGAPTPSVDAWLEQNPTFIQVGKIAIAIALLCYEQTAKRSRPKNNWYELLFDRLRSPFDEFQHNKLSIITFNYDRSLEEFLFKSFRHTHSQKSEQECRHKLNKLELLHVYGSLGRLEWQFDDPENPLVQIPHGAKLDSDRVICAANNIKIMPEDQELSTEFRKARTWLRNSQAIYFLGFGYHKNNMIRLGTHMLHKHQKIMGTCSGLDFQRISEVERLGITGLHRNLGLHRKRVYEFLHDYVDFNNSGYPRLLPPSAVSSNRVSCLML